MTVVSNVMDADLVPSLDVDLAQPDDAQACHNPARAFHVVGLEPVRATSVPYRVGESMALYADVAKAKKLLGWEPSVSIDEGISRTVHYYQRKIKC
mgnify:CR=1 FL=1